MKTKLTYVLGLTVVLGLSSCDDESIVSQSGTVKSITVTGQDFLYGDDITRAAYTVDATGFHFSWTEGDTVGIYPVGGDQVAFPISSGEGSQTAQFDGGAWALRSSYLYAAYYPYVKGNYMVDETQIPVSFIGLTQNGNGSLDCLDRYDYQASVATRPNTDGNVNIELKHLGSFVRFQLTMPVADTYKSITLTSSKTPFVTSGTFDLTKDDIAITPKSTSPSIIINLHNTATIADDKVLTIYVMLAPTDLSDSEISISIEGATYKSYSATVSGKNMIAGKAYSYSAKVQSGTNINGNDVEWDDEGNEILPQYEYVDLGLSVNWATCNVGANKPEEYGDYYAWGETEPKTDYSWSTYKWCNGSSSTLTKYGTVDNKTVLAPEDDVAHVMWGGDWRMPTKEEQDELLYSCTWKWYSSGNSEFGGVAGFKVTSNMSGYTDRFIFLPAAGGRYDTYLDGVGSGGDYWSSSLDAGSPGRVWYLRFYSYSHYTNNDYRDDGRSVRPVCPSSEEWLDKISIALDSNSKSILQKEKCTLTATVMHGNDILNHKVSWSSANSSIATVSETGVVTGKAVGSTTISATCHGKTATCEITVRKLNYNGHGYVDLGLSVNWATCNVGANKPEGYGDYYAWGETETKSTYDFSNYKWYGSSSTLTKYGTVDNKTVLDPEDDVAHVKWGGDWRMPTKAEQDELRNNCTWTWYSSGNSEFGGVAGYKVTSTKSGYTNRFIFLPAAGYRYDTYLYDVGSNGDYWSSSLNTVLPDYAWFLYFNSDYLGANSYSYRRFGRSVRPVCP